MVYLGTFVQDGFAEMPSVTWRTVFFFFAGKVRYRDMCGTTGMQQIEWVNAWVPPTP